MNEVREDVLSEGQLVRYAHDVAQLQRLRHIYEHLLPDVIDPASPVLPSPSVREATVLFSDIRGFTLLAQRLARDPERLLAILNEHLAAAVDAVLTAGGVVEKFVGDGLLASFGARSHLPDHAERAVAAGLNLIGANERLNRTGARARDFRLEVGVGIAAGTLVVGVIGPPRRAEFGILGDPVNLAARLVANASPGEMLIEEGVYEAVRSSVKLETLGKMSIRGRSGDVTVHRIGLLSSTPGLQVIRV